MMLCRHYQVEQGAADFAHVFFDLNRAAIAASAGIAPIATRTGIEGGDEHQAGGERDAPHRAGNRDVARFEGLTEDFERAAVELGQLVQKEDSMMRQRNLTRRGGATTADQAGFADCVVRRAKRPLEQQRLAGGEQSDGAVDLRRLDAFAGAEVGHDGRQALREKRFTGAGRTDHQEMMSARRGDSDGAFGHLLPFDVGIIGFIAGEFRLHFTPTEGDRLDVELPRVKADRFCQSADCDDFDPIHNRRFLRIGEGNEQPLLPLFARRDRHRQGPFDVADCPFQRQFADGGEALEPVGLQLAARGQEPDGDGKIERRGFLGKLGGGRTRFG